MTIAMRSLWFLLGLLVVVRAQITSPSGSTVWTNGDDATITWSGLSGSEFTIVLYRTNTQFHHTIVSYTQNTGSFTWQVEIPSQDGWPASSSSDLVYEIDFYANGGWNNGGILVAKSSEFAIQYSPGGQEVVATEGDPGVLTTTIYNPSPIITIYTTPGQNGQGFSTVTVYAVITTPLGTSQTGNAVPGMSTATVVVGQQGTQTVIYGATTIGLAGTTVTPQQVVLNGGTSLARSGGWIAFIVLISFTFLLC